MRGEGRMVQLKKLSIWRLGKLLEKDDAPSNWKPALNRFIIESEDQLTDFF